MTQPKIDHLEAVRPDSIQQVTIGGKSVYAFTVKPGDVQPWDSANVGPNGKPNERAELSLDVAPSTQKGKSQYDVHDNSGKWFYNIDVGAKAGLPAHDPAKHEWAMIWQAHPQDDNPSGFKGFTGVSIHGGQITLESPKTAGTYFAKELVPIDTTVPRRLEINWSAHDDGYVKWVDSATGRVIGRYDGPTIAAGEYKYLKQGYYRAGGLPEGTIYSSLMDIGQGDPAAATTTPPAATPPPTPDTSSTVQVYGAQLKATRDAMQKEVDAINAMLGKP